MCKATRWTDITRCKDSLWLIWWANLVSLFVFHVGSRCIWYSGNQTVLDTLGIHRYLSHCSGWYPEDAESIHRIKIPEDPNRTNLSIWPYKTLTSLVQTDTSSSCWTDKWGNVHNPLPRYPMYIISASQGESDSNIINPNKQMPRHLISDFHQWINEIPTVLIYYLAKPQPRELIWQNLSGKKTLLSFTLVRYIKGRESV